MKRLTNLSIIIFMFFFYSFSYADWADEWLGTMLSENPSAYEGQQRGYFSGGGFTARKKMHTDYLFSAQSPKINVGCGGIDIFLGAFSFLNPEYLVDKATRIIQAAPVYAFELALSNLCQSCDNIMAKIQNIMDKLNSLQLDECKASKTMVTIGAEFINNGESKTLSAINSGIKQGVDNFFTEAKKEAENDPVTKQKAVFLGLNQTINKLTNPVNNSFLETFKNDTGLNYIDEVRALVGDIYINWDSNSGFQSQYVEGCPHATIDFFVNNKILNKTGATSDSPCGETAHNYKNKVKLRMDSILDKMNFSPTIDLNTSEKEFISFVELPIYSLLRDNIMESTYVLNSEDDMLILPVAYAYAYGVLNSIYNTAKTVVTQIQANIIFGDKDNTLAGLITKIDKMLKRIDDLKKDSERKYLEQKKNFNDLIENTVVYKQKREFIKKTLTESLFKTK